MRGVKCICLDDSNRPNDIPESKWIKQGEVYHITHIFNMVAQRNVLGCEIAETDISMYAPYNCFRITRFGFEEQDIENLYGLMMHCSELNEIEQVDFQEIINRI